MTSVFLPNTWLKWFADIHKHNEDKNEVTPKVLNSRDRRRIDWQAALVLEQLLLAGVFRNDAQVRWWIKTRYTRFVFLRVRNPILQVMAGAPPSRRLVGWKPFGFLVAMLFCLLPRDLIRTIQVYLFCLAQVSLMKDSWRKLRKWFDTEDLTSPNWKATAGTRMFQLLNYKRKAPSLGFLLHMSGKLEVSNFPGAHIGILKQGFASYVAYLSSFTSGLWLGREVDPKLRKLFFGFPLFPDVISKKSRGMPRLASANKMAWRWLLRISHIVYLLEQQGYVYRHFSIGGRLFVHVCMVYDKV
jgi:hypothetical protein